jgi:hypothetical protein
LAAAVSIFVLRAVKVQDVLMSLPAPVRRKTLVSLDLRQSGRGRQPMP